MIATYGGKCPFCGSRYSVGTPIHKTDSGSWCPDTCIHCQRNRLEVPTRLHELMKVLELHRCIGSSHDDLTVFSLTCHVEFEPWGRASEDWDLVWTLTAGGQTFTDEDVYGVIEKAMRFFIGVKGKAE